MIDARGARLRRLGRLTLGVLSLAGLLLAAAPGEAQARTRINFTDTNQSGFFIAPNPAQATNHPFKFGNVQANFDAFKAAVDVWVQAEKTSQ